MGGIIKCVCINKKRKSSAQPVGCCRATLRGLEGDIHFGYGDRHVSMLPWEVVHQYFIRTGEAFRWGRFGENLVVDGINWKNLRKGDVLKTPSVELEIVKIGARSAASEAYRGEKVCAPLEDYFIFGKIIREGTLREQDPIMQTLV